jgi:hypothetical protein
MITENILQRIGRLVKLAPWLPKEKQEELHEIIKELMVAESKEGVMPNSAISDLAEAVPTEQVRAIVNDLKGFGQAEPGGFLGPTTKTEPRPPARSRHIPLESPAGLKYVDQQIDVQDALDKVQLRKRLRGEG